MKTTTLSLASGLVLLCTSSLLLAQQPPSYARNVRPFLAKYCLECHNAATTKAGLNLETYKTLRSGSDNGEVLTPGQPDKSKLVVLVEGKEKPRMPPRKAKYQPTFAEAGVLRAWVGAGALEDSTAVTATLPEIKPRVPANPPVSALAYSPGGKLLAAGAYKEIALIDPKTGDLLGKLTGFRAGVTALTFSHDGNRLAAAVGNPGVGADILVYSVPSTGQPWGKPEQVAAAHHDVIQRLAFSPDDKVLATCSYDRQIKLWDTSTFKEPQTLKEHSDSVYGLSFRPDGKLFATAAADRAVKVWEAASGKLLYTLGEATDWLYTLAWSPDGNHLAAAGVDKSIRVWEATPEGGKVVHSVFAHEGPVLQLAYAADGGTLYSLGEDRSVKAWDAGRMVERKVYERQPEAALALAVRPDHQQIAVGRYDGALVLLEEPTGKVQAEPLPVKPKPPEAKKLSPPSGQRGRPIRLLLEGANLDGVTELTVAHPGVAARVLPEGKGPTALQVEVTFPSDTPAGVYELSLKNAAGPSAPLKFTVDLFAQTGEKEPNNSPGTGQKIMLPASVAGTVGQAGDVDYYRFEAQAGQQLGVQVVLPAGSKLDAYLYLTDAAGHVLAQSTDGLLGFTFQDAGTYALGIRDRDFRGDGTMSYHLHLGEVPIITSVFPLGLQRGTEAEIHLEGVFLGSARSVRLKGAAGAGVGTPLPVSVNTPQGKPLGDRRVVLGEFPEVLAQADKVLSLPVPGTANGRIAQPGATDTWRFAAKKGQPLIVEVNARRLGSALDSYIEVLDAQSRPVPRATLRSQARTYTTFRDHDSSAPGIRLEDWRELAINDYLLVGNELVRIRDLPRTPDDDCIFFSRKGQRVSFLDTTPTHHSMGTPMYKVALHPPGMTFSPNGFPVVTLHYRNDDGGPGYGRDSRLFFDAPADGDYLVRVGDARGQAGVNYAYRLTVRPPRPSFHVSFKPPSPAVWKGEAVPVTVEAERIDGFAGPINVRLENLPPGFSAPATSIPAGEESTAFALFAEPTAQNPGKAPALKLTAEALIDGQTVRQEADGGVPTLIAPGEVVARTQESEVSVRPGGEVRLTVAIERRQGFTGRVPLEVRGLPHGVRVLDIGLNGILVNEHETTRTVAIYCEPWVTPIEHPFVVLARREGKNSEHAARSVLLKVSASGK